MTGVVICAPLWFERRALRRASTPVVRTGMGRDRSRAASIALGGTARLVAGVAGGIGAGVAPGDVVVATAVHGDDGAVAACPTAPLLAAELRRILGPGVTVHVGPIASRRTITGTTDPALRAAGPLAVDMESVWLAPAGDVPFAVVRVVTDTAGAPLWHPGILRRGTRALATLRRAVPALDAWATAVSSDARVRAATHPLVDGPAVHAGLGPAPHPEDAGDPQFTMHKEVS